MIHGTLLRPLPYAEPDRVVWLSDGHADFGGTGLNGSVPNLVDLLDGSRLLQSSASYRVLSGNLVADERPERVQILFTSSEMLDVLGPAPRLGRDLVPDDDIAGAQGVAIPSGGLWRSHYGGDPDVVGRGVMVDGRSVRIVGVSPPELTFPDDQQLIMALHHVGAEFSRGGARLLRRRTARRGRRSRGPARRAAILLRGARRSLSRGERRPQGP